MTKHHEPMLMPLEALASVSDDEFFAQYPHRHYRVRPARRGEFCEARLEERLGDGGTILVSRHSQVVAAIEGTPKQMGEEFRTVRAAKIKKLLAKLEWWSRMDLDGYIGRDYATFTDPDSNSLLLTKRLKAPEEPTAT